MGVHVPNVMRMPGKTGARRFTAKTYLKLLMGVGLVALVGGGAGTFASFNATVSNPATFTTGTLVLSDSVPSQSTCFSVGSTPTAITGSSNTNACPSVISVPLGEPGASATGTVTLANAGTLPASELSLALSCNPATPNLTYHGTGALCTGSGSDILGFYVQEWNGNPASGGTPYDCLYGATEGLGVSCSAAAISGFGGSPVTLSDVNPAYSTTLATAISNAGTVTSIAVPSLPLGVTSGDTITVATGGNSQTFTATAAVASTGSPTSIPVTSATANFAFATGSIVTDTSLYNITLASALSTTAPITSLPVTALLHAVGTGDTITITSGLSTQNFTASSAAAVGATSIPVVSATPNSAYLTTSTVTDSTANASAPIAALEPTGAPGATRYFTVGLDLPQTADNSVQGLNSSLNLTWTEDQ